jgi:hypothetical protein
MSIFDRRNIVELTIPGSMASVLQDMGAESALIGFEGEIMGPKAGDILQELYKKYNQGEPFEFFSDIAVIADVHKVVIKSLDVEHVAGIESSYRYHMTVQEYREPRRQKHTEESKDQDKQAQDSVDNESEIDDIRGQILDAEGNPAKGIKVTIKGPDGDKQVTTDDQGFYEILDAKEGKYEIIVNQEGYESEKREFEIKKGKSEV